MYIKRKNLLPKCGKSVKAIEALDKLIKNRKSTSENTNKSVCVSKTKRKRILLLIWIRYWSRTTRWWLSIR